MTARTRTLRLGTDAAAALDRIVETEHTSANAAIERAVIEYDKKRVDTRETALRRLFDENRSLMERLG